MVDEYGRSVSRQTWPLIQPPAKLQGHLEQLERETPNEDMEKEHWCETVLRGIVAEQLPLLDHALITE